MNYTKIDDCEKRVKSAMLSAANDLNASNINYTGMTKLVEAQLKLAEAMYEQMEELHKRIQRLEYDKAP